MSIMNKVLIGLDVDRDLAQKDRIYAAWLGGLQINDPVVRVLAGSNYDKPVYVMTEVHHFTEDGQIVTCLGKRDYSQFTGYSSGIGITCDAQLFPPEYLWNQECLQLLVGIEA